MFYAGDEYAPDECTSFLDHPGWDEVPWQEDYCDYCERDGHTFRTCPARDDEDSA